MLAKLKLLFCIEDKRDERGVPTTKTGVGSPSQFLLVGLLILSLPIIGTAITLLLSRGMSDHQRSLWISQMGMMTVGLALPGLSGGFYFIRLFRQSRKWWSVEKSCSKLGIPQEDLMRFVSERNIRPRYNIDGKDYYDPADFKDAVTLLRAAQQPTSPDTLLRPATNAQTPPEQLLRPARHD